MKFSSLEDLAERWTFAHTLAVVAWVVVLVLGVAVLFKNHQPATYPVVQDRKIYAAENATFKYPANWTLNNCDPNRPFIELPGTIRAEYKGSKSYQLTIYGADSFRCIKDRPERFDIYRETMTASDSPCALATSTRGELLSNGLYLQLQIQGDRVLAVQIRQNSCYAPADAVVLGFAFADPQAMEGDRTKWGLPSVRKEDFITSPQYRDIQALAESIKY
jgi:hypothetical protein